MMARVVKGVSEGVLMTEVHPTARAGPIFLAIMAAGKFQGQSKATTPMGCLMEKFLVPGTEQGMTSP